MGELRQVREVRQVGELIVKLRQLGELEQIRVVTIGSWDECELRQVGVD